MNYALNHISGKKQRAEHYSHNPYYYPPMEAKYNGSEGKSDTENQEETNKNNTESRIARKKYIYFY